MKKMFFIFVLVSFAIAPVMAQVKGQSLNGATGLYTIPTGHIGWNESIFALDFGYRAIINDDHKGTAHIPSITLSLVKMFEFSFAYDIQPDPDGVGSNYNNDDILLGFKLQLPTGNTAISLGINVDLIETGYNSFNTFQPYIAITYPGNFFRMPAETTMFIGKTFHEENNNSDIDFGMGFDLVLLPDIFNGLIHLLIDFANFGYSSNAWPNPGSVEWRGVFNVGFRFDLSKFPVFNKYKFVLDAAFNDILDDGSRSFTLGVCFGIPFM